MTALADRVAGTISRYSMLTAGSRVGVAVSGGADSLCLLHVLRELAPQWQLTLYVLHVDHGMRGDASRADAEFAGRVAAACELPFLTHRVEVPALAEATGDNLEQAARAARHAVLLHFKQEVGLDRIALGHTLDDQAETVLARLLRGACSTGLAGIHPVTAQGLVRPLLEIRRDEVRAWLRENGREWREDPTNLDLRFSRNRLRLQLLPLLERDWNPAIASILAQTADVAWEEERFWAGFLGPRLKEFARHGAGIVIPVVAFTSESPAVARRLAREAIRSVKGDLRSIQLSHVDGLLGLARSPQGDGRIQLPGVDVFRSFDWIRLGVPGEFRWENRNYCYPLSVPGPMEIPEAGLVLHFQRFAVQDAHPQAAEGYNWGDGVWDGEIVSLPLVVRNWRPGDRYQPSGWSREAKLKELFQLAKIPLWERRSWPVVVSGEQIVWTRRFGVAAAVAASAQSRVWWKVTEGGVTQSLQT